jgi:hypothetical protein
MQRREFFQEDISQVISVSDPENKKQGNKDEQQLLSSGML